MIYYLKGTVFLVADSFTVLDVGGVGYQVFMPLPDLGKLPGIGDEVLLYIYYHLREDSLQLYGFSTQEDRNLFTILTSVSGIGPKIALAILSQIPSKDLIPAIVKEDTSLLSSVSGLGAKKASRLVIELKDKLPKVFEVSSFEHSGSTKPVQLGALQDDLILALKTLGYHQEEIKRGIKKAADFLSPDMTLEDGIKVLLKWL